ncbi:putative methyltransferase-domain-containing protein [Lactarius pseudohatsudake]|nr:putative methyltransferase-domain-containing protein [Lactarius pseudohatsudake]
MPKATRRKFPVTLAGRHDGSSSTPHASRTVIRKFHTLLKQQKSAQGDALANVNREIEELGGLEAYQRMSCIGQSSDRGGGSEKVLIGWLKQMGWAAPVAKENEKERHRLLEVGAVRPDNYGDCASWIDVMAIDLHSRHPSILEQDFLLMDSGQHREAWDVISLSLVLNFLPLPCVNNSRYTTMEHMKELMDTIGFHQLEERWRPGGKMAYWLYQKKTPQEGCHGERFSKKKVLRQGNRNNFHILVT